MKMVVKIIISFASKSLTSTEEYYADIEIAVVFGVAYYHTYLYAAVCTVVSDKKKTGIDIAQKQKSSTSKVVSIVVTNTTIRYHDKV